MRRLEMERNSLRQVSGDVLRILIVEDNAMQLKLYRSKLSHWPFEVAIFTASNGFEGLVMAGEKHPHLLICDLRLPGVNGFQIVRALCTMERFNDLTIVVVSSLSIAEIEAHGALPERVMVMAKPISFTKLEDVARSLLLRI